MNYAIKQFGFLGSRKLWAVLGLFAVLAVGQSLWQRSAVAARAIAPVACTYTALPLNFNLPNANAVAQLNVIITTQAGCTHKMTSNVDWLTVLSGTKTGTDGHQFKVAANPGAAERVGWLTVGGWAVKVTQPGSLCTYVVSPAQVNAPGHQASNTTINVATVSSCNWTAVSNANWISVVGDPSQTGSGQVTLSMSANASESPRTGTVTIAGKTVTVTQAAWNCSYVLDASSANVAATGGNGNVQVITPSHCSWTAASNVAWMSIVSGANIKGAGTVTYNVKANDSANQRSGTLTIAGKTFTVTQAGNPCVYSVSPNSVAVPNPLGYLFKVTVTGGGAGCSYTQASNESWIVNAGALSTPGKTEISYYVFDNTNAATRTGSVTVAGKTITVTQPGQSCTFAVSPTLFNLPDGSFANLLKVNVDTQPGCIWTTSSNSGLGNWIKIESGINQVGDGAAYFSVETNPSVNARTGTLTVAGKTVTVNQPSGCPAISLNQPSIPNGVVGETYSHTFTASGGVTPHVFNIIGVNLPSGLSLGSNGVLKGTPLTAGTYNFNIKVFDQYGCFAARDYALTITPQACPALTLSPQTLTPGVVGVSYAQTLAASGGTAPYTFSLNAGTLPPGVQLNGNALTGTPTTKGAYSFTIKATDANGCAATKQYAINISCAAITLNPATLPAATVGAAYSQILSATGGVEPYTFSLLPGETLPQGLTLTNGVLSGTPSSPTVGYNFTLRVTDANGCLGTRSYLLPVAPAPVVTVSAASYKEGAAPESIVAAFGAKLASTTQVANTQPLPTTLANITLGITDSAGTNRLAPLFFVSPGQINYLIPQGTALGTATIRVFNGNEMVAAGTLEITNVAPGLFAANANGQGVASALALRVKSDGSLSYEPIAQYQNNQFICQPINLGPESDQVFLVLYGTGLRNASNLAEVTTMFGGDVNGEVLFVGAAPGFTGLDQLNVRVPRSLIGRGEIDIAPTVAGKAANITRVNIQ